MSKTLVCVMVHSDAQATFDRHLAHYEAHGCDIITYSPVDAPVSPRGHLALLYGHRSHHSPEANRRFKRLISFLTTTAYDDAWIFEYDALCLSPELPRFSFKGCGDSASRECPVIAANCFYDDGKRFQGSLFTHPPIYANQPALRSLNASLKELPDDTQEGFWDRMAGLAIERAKLLPFDFLSSGYGYAQNTIGNEHWNDAKQAAYNGAICFHGVKCGGALQAITDGQKLARLDDKLRYGLEIPV